MSYNAWDLIPSHIERFVTDDQRVRLERRRVGDYQYKLFVGEEPWSLAGLKGGARGYGDRYKRARDRLLAFLQGVLGEDFVTVVTGEKGKQTLVWRGKRDTSAPSVDDICAYEAGAMTEEEAVGFFQKLVNSGLAWSLQGSYGRTARALIEQDLVTP